MHALIGTTYEKPTLIKRERDRDRDRHRHRQTERERDRSACTLPVMICDGCVLEWVV